jgi:hypothetical protein
MGACTPTSASARQVSWTPVLHHGRSDWPGPSIPLELRAKLFVGHRSSGTLRNRSAALSGVMSRCGWASSS